MNNKKIDRFPIYKADYIFNKFNGELQKPVEQKLKFVKILYPARLDAMAINPAAVCYNNSMIFTPGEVVISVDTFITVKITFVEANKGDLDITKASKRQSLIKHAYYLMCDVLKVRPSLKIDVSSNIPKHCGFGSSSSTITAVATAINELYGNPISNSDLIKYLASNHGEEIDDNDDDNLKMVQCIGGGATGGLTDEGIIVIAGQSTTIAKMKYNSKVLICTPKDFVQKNALELMELEENNLHKFKKTGDEFAKDIAYNLLHKAIPSMINGNIKDLADVVFEYRFNMGSIENCSFVYGKMVDHANQLRKLYEKGYCEFLALSSVGPAFFILENDEKNLEKCKDCMKSLHMDIIEANVFNETYKVIDKKALNEENFWQKKRTAKDFLQMPLSPYITKTIDEVLKNNDIKTAIDIGCGAGRYSQYLLDKIDRIIAIDKHKEMYQLQNDKIKFICAEMSEVPLQNEYADLVLSIGVMHNATTKEELEKSIEEILRLLKNSGIAIISIFTNDVITSDLKELEKDKYSVKDRDSMILVSKEEINRLISKHKIDNIHKIDEHITDVGGGKRNVYTILLKK